MDEANLAEAGAMQREKTPKGDKPDTFFTRVVKTIANPISAKIRPNFMRSTVTDAVPHAEHEINAVTEPIPIERRHDCRAAGADCTPGPSTPPSRFRNNVIGSHVATRPDDHFMNRAASASTGPPSKDGSCANAGSRSNGETPGTTPENSDFVPRPGCYTSSDLRSMRTNSDRILSSTAAEAVRIKNEEVSPSLSWEQLPEPNTRSRTLSQPSPNSKMISSRKILGITRIPEKGKSKKREHIPDIDGELSKKEKRKSFDPPPVFDPGHNPWKSMAKEEKLKARAEVSSAMSKYSLSSALKRKQAPVEEPVGPGNEPAPDPQVFAPEDEKSSGYKSIFRRSGGSATKDTSADVTGPSTTTAAATAAAQEDVDTSSLSSSSTDSGYTISDSSDDNKNHRVEDPRDSTRASDHRRHSSVDIETLSSAQIEAANYEPTRCELLCNKKKRASGCEDPAHDASQSESSSKDGSKKLELKLYKSNDAEGHFELCESPAKMNNGDGRLESISEL